MDGILWILLVVAIFALGYYCGKSSATPKPLPYRWKCLVKDCDFKCSSDNLSVLNDMADDHVRQHNGHIHGG